MWVKLLMGCSVGLLAAGCHPSPPPPVTAPARTTIDYVPTGSSEQIVEACFRSGIAMGSFLLRAGYPVPGGSNPRSWLGFDDRKRDHNERAANALLRKLEDRYDPLRNNTSGWFQQSVEQLGWVMLNDDFFLANDTAWPTLENRLNWCVDHFKVDITVQVPPDNTQSAVALAPAGDPYQTQTIEDADSGYRIVIEHQPDNP